MILARIFPRPHLGNFSKARIVSLLAIAIDDILRFSARRLSSVDVGVVVTSVWDNSSRLDGSPE